MYWLTILATLATMAVAVPLAKLAKSYADAKKGPRRYRQTDTKRRVSEPELLLLDVKKPVRAPATGRSVGKGKSQGDVARSLNCDLSGRDPLYKDTSCDDDDVEIRREPYNLRARCDK